MNAVRFDALMQLAGIRSPKVLRALAMALQEGLPSAVAADACELSRASVSNALTRVRHVIALVDRFKPDC